MKNFKLCTSIFSLFKDDADELEFKKIQGLIKNFETSKTKHNFKTTHLQLLGHPMYALDIGGPD